MRHFEGAFYRSIIDRLRFNKIISDKQQLKNGLLFKGLFQQCCMMLDEILSKFTLDFNSLLKNHFECSFVSSECSLQSSNVCFEVRSDN